MPAHLQNRLAVTTQELAELLGVSNPHIRNVTLGGQLPYFRLGTRILIPMEAVRDLIDSAFVPEDEPQNG